MTIRGKRVGLVSALVVLAVGAAGSAAPTYNFTCITGSNPVGEAQFLVTVLPDLNPAKVEFYFTNTGPVASSITDVYFDDGSLLDLATIINGPGVAFSTPATPPDLPAGNSITPQFETTDAFSADADSPHMPENGVNPGESVGIVFDLQPGNTYSDVLSNLASGELRIGLRGETIGAGGNSFVNTPGTPPAVPAPGAILLGALGIGWVGWLRRRGSLDR